MPVSMFRPSNRRGLSSRLGSAAFAPFCALAFFVLVACGSSAPAASTTDSALDATSANDPALDPARWPRDFVAGYGSGPALFLSQAADAAAFGYLEPGVEIRIASLPEDGRIKVLIDGPLKVRAWIPAERLALRVAEGGRIPETPISVAPGNLLRYLGPTADPAIASVEGRARLTAIRAPSYAGIYPMARLTAEPVQSEAPASTGTVRLPAGEPIPLFSSPTEQIATLPALDEGLSVSLAVDRGEWKGIRIGEGPFMVGYVNVPVTPITVAPTEAVTSEGTLPERLQIDAERPVWRIAQGTRVRFGADNTVIAIVEEVAFAREMGRFEDSDEVDVFVAVNDSVAVRGLVPASALIEAPELSPAGSANADAVPAGTGSAVGSAGTQAAQ